MGWLKGDVALITGGESGLGGALVESCGLIDGSWHQRFRIVGQGGDFGGTTWSRMSISPFSHRRSKNVGEGTNSSSGVCSDL